MGKSLDSAGSDRQERMWGKLAEHLKSYYRKMSARNGEQLAAPLVELTLTSPGPEQLALRTTAPAFPITASGNPDGPIEPSDGSWI